MSDHITDHVAQAIARLPQQYKGKVLLEGLISAFVGPWQAIEDALIDLRDKRFDLDAAEGVQLDRYGAIIGQPRESLSDADYRARIRLRIVQNLSMGEPDRLIDVYADLVDATVVMYQENWPAAISMMANAPITPGQETIIFKNLQSIAPAGVRIDYIGEYDPDEAFSFAGGSDGAGFGDLTDLMVGGLFAKRHIPEDIDLQFAPGTDDEQGLGDVRDPEIGGHFESL